MTKKEEFLAQCDMWELEIISAFNNWKNTMPDWTCEIGEEEMLESFKGHVLSLIDKSKDLQVLRRNDLDNG